MAERVTLSEIALRISSEKLSRFGVSVLSACQDRIASEGEAIRAKCAHIADVADRKQAEIRAALDLRDKILAGSV